MSLFLLMGRSTLLLMVIVTVVVGIILRIFLYHRHHLEREPCFATVVVLLPLLTEDYSGGCGLTIHGSHFKLVFLPESSSGCFLILFIVLQNDFGLPELPNFYRALIGVLGVVYLLDVLLPNERGNLIGAEFETDCLFLFDWGPISVRERLCSLLWLPPDPELLGVGSLLLLDLLQILLKGRVVSIIVLVSMTCLRLHVLLNIGIYQDLKLVKLRGMIPLVKKHVPSVPWRILGEAVISRRDTGLDHLVIKIGSLDLFWEVLP